MNNSIFKTTSKANEVNIPFQLDQDLLLDWLLGLGKTESREACDKILQLLKALNQDQELAAKNRFAFLKLIYQYLQLHNQNLTSACWDGSWPVSAKEQENAQMAEWSYLALSEGFFMAAQDLENRVDEVLALYMSCHCLGQAQLHIAAVYSHPDPFFWQLLYRVFAWIEKYGLFTSKINEGQFKNLILNDALGQLFIFQICDSHQFRPRDMQTIFNFLPKVCGDFTTYKLSDLKFQTDVLKIPYLQAVANNFGNLAQKLAEPLNQRQDLIVFDLNQNVPPIILNPTCSPAVTSLRYFTAASVVERLDKVLDQGDAWSGILKSINHELFARVSKTLAPGRKRKHARSATEQTMLGVIGFENIISFLYKVQYKNRPKNDLEPARQSAANENLILKTDRDKIHPQMGAIDGGFTEIDFVYQFEQDHPIWNYKNNLEIINQAVVLKRMTIFDHSASGYLLHWADDESLKAKVGDIFGIISEDRKRLEIALIRRIAITKHDYKFGTELLGLESEAVIVTRADDASVCGWGIFIPAINTEELCQAPNIIYPIGLFHKGDNVCIYKNNKKISTVITKELNATATIAQGELANL